MNLSESLFYSLLWNIQSNHFSTRSINIPLILTFDDTISGNICKSYPINFLQIWIYVLQFPIIQLIGFQWQHPFSPETGSIESEFSFGRYNPLRYPRHRKNPTDGPPYQKDAKYQTCDIMPTLPSSFVWNLPTFLLSISIYQQIKTQDETRQRSNQTNGTGSNNPCFPSVHIFTDIWEIQLMRDGTYP